MAYTLPRLMPLIRWFRKVSTNTHLNFCLGPEGSFRAFRNGTRKDRDQPLFVISAQSYVLWRTDRPQGRNAKEGLPEPGSPSGP